MGTLPPALRGRRRVAAGPTHCYRKARGTTCYGWLPLVESARRPHELPSPTHRRKAGCGAGIEPEYLLEYREAKAKQFVEQAIREGLIDLEDTG